MPDELKNAFEHALRLKYLMDWVKRPSTMNQVLTVNQLQHRGFKEEVQSFLDMQFDCTLITDN